MSRPAGDGSDPGWGALRGIRVVDLTAALAGPFCTQLLADHGAEVIKVEPPGGDMMRVNPAMFEACNRNKLSIALDLKDPAGRETLLRLSDTADVIVENYRAGVMERLGLPYERFSARNPRLVYAAIRGFGDPRTGASPYVDRPCFDIVAQAMGGLASVTGSPDRGPTPVGIGVGDIYPGTLAAFGIMAALHEARSSGRGQFLDVAMVDAVLALCEQIVTQLAVDGVTIRPAGQRHPLLTPFGVFAARDGWVALAADQQRAFERLCDAMGRVDLIADARFGDPRSRWRHRDELYPVVEAFVASHTRSELDALLGGRVPFGPVYDAGQIIDDAHFRARDMLCELPRDEGEESLVVAGVPIKLDRTPGGVHRRAPSLDEHRGLLPRWLATAAGSQSRTQDADVG